MQILLETKNRDEVINLIVSILTVKYNEYKSLFECHDDNMKGFILTCIKERLCDTKAHFCSGYIENIGNILLQYIFCFNCDENSSENGTYKVLYDIESNKYFTNGWVDWSLWDDYDKCINEACEVFYGNNE